MKLNFVMYTLQLVVRGELSLSLVIKWMSTQYETSGSTPVMSSVKGASQLRQITLVRFALVRLLTAASLPGKKGCCLSLTTATSLMLTQYENVNINSVVKECPKSQIIALRPDIFCSQLQQQVCLQ